MDQDKYKRQFFLKNLNYKRWLHQQFMDQVRTFQYTHDSIFFTLE